MTSAVSAFRPRDAEMLLVLALMWGNSFMFIKIAVAVVPPPWIVTARMTIGAALLLLLALRSRERAPRDLTSLWNVAVTGLAGAALPWLGQAWAQQFLDSGLMAVINACTPVP